MSDMTMVDTDRLKQTVAKLDTTVAAIRANVKTVREALAALDKGWKSDVKNEFFRVANADLEAFLEMEAQYDEVSRILEQSITTFVSNEEAAISSLKTCRR
ncbi:hypothetical protein LJC27_02500 [Christensenellaceae bacterium OttesenSCG-928-M15]|nr:hypothetical protein [Christensenellaceae bacterium OttesenSCG-928-M15]